jgi:hypothetical protein
MVIKSEYGLLTIFVWVHAPVRLLVYVRAQIYITQRLTQPSVLVLQTVIYASMTSLDNRNELESNSDDTLTPDPDLLQFLRTSDGVQSIIQHIDIEKYNLQIPA